MCPIPPPLTLEQEIGIAEHEAARQVIIARVRKKWAGKDAFIEYRNRKTRSRATPGTIKKRRRKVRK